MNQEQSTQQQPGKKAPAEGQAFARERSQFRALVSANPNYFGNLKESPFDPVLSIQSNKTFEEIGCLGLNPKTERLEAVVYIKEPSGYGGGVCSSGTTEYVRFFLSYDNGATWQDQGVTGFTAYDIPEGTLGAKQLNYAATLPIQPDKKFCFQNNTARMRAILSWNLVPPPNPNFVPVWGEVQDAYIQIPPRKFFLIPDLVAAVDVKLPPEVVDILDPSAPVQLSKPKPLQAVELHELYRGKEVELHRYALPELQQFIEQPGAGEQVEKSYLAELIPGLQFNLDDLVAKLFPTDGNTSYEELECIGLNTNLDTLVGVIHVKKNSGYSGGPCTAGSTEYVTFWADFNDNGIFETCLGTASVNVHDIANIPAQGLRYAVALPVDLKHHRKPCEQGPVVVRIRAILSWQSVPPCANPNFVPVWGNREEALVHITPGPEIPVGTVLPKITALGGIGTGKINDFTGLTAADAIFATNNLAADSLGRPCPFGGVINVIGPSYPGYKYRVQVRRIGELTWTTLSTTLQVLDSNGDYHPHAPNGAGLFTYLPVNQNMNNLLALWHSSGDDMVEFRLQIFDIANNLLPGVDQHRLQLDNTGPDASVDILIGPGNCGKFSIGDVLSGKFVARDLYFGSYSLGVKPAVNPPGVGVPVPSSGNVQTPPAPGSNWSLNTAGMQSCGYIIELVVRDRAILDSVSGNHHWNSDAAGFCLE